MKKNPEVIIEEKRSRSAFGFLVRLARKKNALVSVKGWKEEKPITKALRDDLFKKNKNLFDVEAVVKQKNFFETV